MQVTDRQTRSRRAEEAQWAIPVRQQLGAEREEPGGNWPIGGGVRFLRNASTMQGWLATHVSWVSPASCPWSGLSARPPPARRTPTAGAAAALSSAVVEVVHRSALTRTPSPARRAASWTSTGGGAAARAAEWGESSARARGGHAATPTSSSASASCRRPTEPGPGPYYVPGVLPRGIAASTYRTSSRSSGFDEDRVTGLTTHVGGIDGNHGVESTRHVGYGDGDGDGAAMVGSSAALQGDRLQRLGLGGAAR